MTATTSDSENNPVRLQTLNTPTNNHLLNNTKSPPIKEKPPRVDDAFDKGLLQFRLEACCRMRKNVIYENWVKPLASFVYLFSIIFSLYSFPLCVASNLPKNKIDKLN
jgi:hypothetical protein